MLKQTQAGAKPRQPSPKPSPKPSPAASPLTVPRQVHGVESSTKDDKSTDSTSTLAFSRAGTLQSLPDEKSANIKVCVRVRPLPEERDGKDKVLICEDVCTDQLKLLNVASEGRRKVTGGGGGSTVYNFDWVLSGDATQEMVYELVGERIVDGLAEGFHGCVFAYGQTGSGKSHTIFGGLNEQRGLLPRLVDGIFSVLERNATSIVKLSYLEIYNEKIRDLLRPDASDGKEDALEVRQHPKFGVFVPGLTSNVVRSPQEIDKLLSYGHKIRVVGCTNMNAVSSRSHAVVSLNVDSIFSESDVKMAGDRVRRRAQMHAVDLAGSERMNDVGEKEARKTESKQINKSLLALSLMISKLAEAQTAKNGADAHIPYRNSKLTYILSDALMGNCRTVMVACASPALSCYAMTDSTMRFASSVKKIRTRPVKNESLDGDLVNQLRAEIQQLKNQLQGGGPQQTEEVVRRINEEHALLKMFQASPEELHEEALVLDTERLHTLGRLGLTTPRLADAWKAGESITDLVDKDADPYLVNVCDDPLLSGCLTYTLPCGEEVSVGCDPECTVQIDGPGVRPLICTLVNIDGQVVEVSLPDLEDDMGYRDSAMFGKRKAISFLHTGSIVDSRGDSIGTDKRNLPKVVARVFVDNALLKQAPLKMRHGQRLRVGRTHVFQLCIPQIQIQEAETEKTLEDITASFTTPDSSEHVLATEYADQLKQRLGSERAIRVFRRIEEIQPLIDEANELTDDIRGDDDYDFVFKVQVLTDITSVEEDPEIQVILNKMEKPDEITAGGNLRFNNDQRQVFTQVWSVQKFEQRLELLRDLHHDVSDRDGCWDVNIDINPWKEDTADVGPGSPGSSPVSPGSPELASKMERELRRMKAAIAEKDAIIERLSSDKHVPSRAVASGGSPEVATASLVAKIPKAASLAGPVQHKVAGLRAELRGGIAKYRERLQMLDEECDASPAFNPPARRRRSSAGGIDSD